MNNKIELDITYREYVEMEEKANTTVRNFEDIEGMPLDIVKNKYQDSLYGAAEIARSLEDMVVSLSSVVGIALGALRELRRIREDNPNISLPFNNNIRSKDPEMDVAKAAMVLSEFTPAVLERIVYSIYNASALFEISNLNERLGDLLPE